MDVSVEERFALHGQASIPDENIRRVLGPIFAIYEWGMYEQALQELDSFVAANPTAEVEVWPYLEVCDRVVRTGIHPDDYEKHRATQTWFHIRLHHWNWWARLWNSPSPRYIRCKYCGRYKDLRIENDLYSVDTCYSCERTYPLPDALWDSVPGQAYIFYRRSVPTRTDRAFYQSFVERFDVLEFNDDNFGGVLRFRLPERYRSWLDAKTFDDHYTSDDYENED